MAQTARPDSDVAVASWVTAPLWSKVDDAVSAPDGTFINSEEKSSGNTSTVQLGLSDVTDPASSASHVLRYRYRRSNTNRTLACFVELRQGATLIASDSVGGIATSFADRTYTLSGAEADAITDYTDLRVHFYGTASGGIAGGTALVIDAVELEIPDAPAASLRPGLIL